MVPSPTWKEGSQVTTEPGESLEPDEANLMGRFAQEQELLRRHISVLKVVRENEPVGIIKLSELTDLPQHKVRYSLRILEQEGLIEPSSLGARTTDLVEIFLPQLRGLIEKMQQTADELRRAVE